MVEQFWGERWLGWTGVDAPEIALNKLRSIRRLVLITIAGEAWLVLTYVPYSSHAMAYGLVATVLVGCAIVGWRDRFARSAVALAFLLLLGSRRLCFSRERQPSISRASAVDPSIDWRLIRS